MTKLLTPESVLNQIVELESDDLEQFGVKGMRWGIRRNSDGGANSAVKKISGEASSEDYEKRATLHTLNAESHLKDAATFKALAEHFEAGHGDPRGFKRPKGMTNEQLAKNARTSAKAKEAIAKEELSKANGYIAKRAKQDGDTLTAIAEHFEAGGTDIPGYTRPTGMSNAQLAKNGRASAAKYYKLAKEAQMKSDKQAAEAARELEELYGIQHSALYNETDLLMAGIKGMKWGIRKDEDGSGSSSKPASAKSMSDKDLKDAVARMNLERSYAKLIAEQSPTSTTARGAKIVGGMVGNAAKNAAQNYMQQAFAAAIKVGVATAVKKSGFRMPELPPLPKDD